MCPHKDKTFCVECNIIMCRDCGDSLEIQGGRHAILSDILTLDAKCRKCATEEIKKDSPLYADLADIIERKKRGEPIRLYTHEEVWGEEE